MTLLATGIWLTHEVFDLGLGEGLSRILRRRAQAAREILQDQLSRGEINVTDAADKDEAAAMVFEYIEAARRGAARRNLRMLAQIMEGALDAPPIYADEFLRWSRVLADLSQEEIIVLVKLQEVHNLPINTVGELKQWNEMDAQMLHQLRAIGVVSNKLELDSIFGALQRTGLVNYFAGGFGGAWYQPTPRLAALLALIDTDAAMAEPSR